MADGDLTVHQAVGEVLNEMGGIGKTSVNNEQHYNYRGIEAVLKELHPLFAKYGIFFAPNVVERVYEERTSARGSKGHCCHLHVEFTVYGPMGDSLTLSTWGEGLDYSDKSTNKAMTAAFKYALFQLFAICDPGEDPDTDGEEAGSNEIPEMVKLIELLMSSGFTLGVQFDIIKAAVGRDTFRKLEDLTTDELSMAYRAVESAIADQQQLEEQN